MTKINLTFQPQPFALIGMILCVFWFGWRLALILFLIELKLGWE